LNYFANNEGMFDRTISIYSAGKTFSMTGLRLGWIIAKKEIIEILNKIHINTVFSIYEPI